MTVECSENKQITDKKTCLSKNFMRYMQQIQFCNCHIQIKKQNTHTSLYLGFTLKELMNLNTSNMFSIHSLRRSVSWKKSCKLQ